MTRANRERDRALARERMRRLRVNGSTLHDRARNYATLMLIKRHKLEHTELKEFYEATHD